MPVYKWTNRILMMMRKLHLGNVLTALLFSSCLLGICACEDESEPGQTEPSENTGQPSAPDADTDSDRLVITDGKARFYLYESENSIREAYGKGISDWSGFTVSVGNKEYSPKTDEDGRAYVDVDASATGVYNAVLTSGDSAPYLGASKYIGLHHPFSMSFHTVKNMVESFPLYASYNEETGNRLVFSMGCSLLELTVKGEAKIASVRIDNPSGEYMAGKGNYMVSKKIHAITEGVPFVVMNCTNTGNFVNATLSGVKICIPIAQGAYSQGLDIRVCDAGHRMMEVKVDPFEVAADRTHKVEITYQPDKNLLYYEGFDNFVWGGDPVKGSTASAFAPSEEAMTTSGGVRYLGYEEALASVSYDTPGTGFIQPETYSSVSNKTVETAHQMSASYVRSRNIGEFSMLYRCQEYQGYVGVGTGNLYRGIFEPKVIPGITGLADLEISFDYCPKVGFKDNIRLDVINGGKIVSCTIDGQPALVEDAQTLYKGITSTYVFRKDAVAVPSSTSSEKQWHKVVCQVENVNDNTRFRVTTNDASEGNHGFYLDDFLISKVKDRKKNALVGMRVLYWNIQNGMWYDQDDNYNNFVAWVKKYDPDVCVWCEGETIFNRQGVKVYGSDRILPNGWKALAARYGHSYVSKSADKDNYPQIITSKYPITTLKEIYDTGNPTKPIVHGAGLFRISYNGNPVNFITFHAYAQKYAPEYEGKTQAEKDASSARNEGDLHREYEIRYICDNVINGAEYAGLKNLLMMGDFNAKSRLDIEHYPADTPSTTWLLHDYIHENTGLTDVIHERNDDRDFFSSVNGDSQRIDFVYASKDMYDRIENAVILIDSWTTLSQDKSVADKGYFCKPSDHRPILVDFKMN